MLIFSPKMTLQRSNKSVIASRRIQLIFICLMFADRITRIIIMLIFIQTDRIFICS